MDITTQIIWLFVLAIPISCISWSVTHEEIFREPREWCVKNAANGRTILVRKAFYLFTCEYCFSHYITIFFIFFCDYKLLMEDWRGYIIAGFSLVFVANLYMSLFGLLRQAIKKEKVEIKKIEKEEENISGS
ncbi:hypothetical protein [Flavobacterium sp. CLA17]|uniref:hypothetical protein n=1 Tax=Flavobacterium sp. CLA17 TaxID=2724135 RepID=UPI001492DC4B|nr:hypothetical protein [Flavobacterium sp. CLA17]QSB25659.1 hypothetical protein HAV12_014910 [Flavobacterium sp. CLA17]